MTKEFFTLDDFNLEGKKILLRVDINSPVNPTTGNILDDSRMRTHATTIRDLRNTKLIILAHQSRPGKKDFTTMEKHGERLSYLLGSEVRYVDSLFHGKALDAIKHMNKGDILLLENTRFYSEEVSLKDKDASKMINTHFIRNLSSTADYFVIDCFAAAHRAQPSIIGFCEVLPTMAGRVMERELRMLNKALHEGKRPAVGIFGGIKADDSIEIMGNLLRKNILDKVITTGGVANIFLAAEGKDLGAPNTEFLKKELEDYDQLVEEAKGLLKESGEKIAVPVDLALNDNGKRKNIKVDKLPMDKQIYDLGLDTIVRYCAEIQKGKTIILNGPSGVFEDEEFSIGTIEIFKSVANANAFKVVGGGHTIAAIERYGLADKIDHLSTGGGSLINLLSGKKLPAVEALKKSKEKYEKGGYKKR